MILSYKKRFIFIAGAKNASTTIEHLLRKYADFALLHTKMGKHMPYAQIANKFDFLFSNSERPIESYFRFGVIRDPIDFLVSWYNFRQREIFSKGRPNLKGKGCIGIEFIEFAEEVMKDIKNKRPFAKIGFQSKRFADSEGKLGVDYLIPLNRLNNEIVELGKALGLKLKTPEETTRNISPKTFSASNIDSALAERLRLHFADDVELYRKANEGEFGNLTEVVRQKVGDLKTDKKKAGGKRNRQK